MNYKRPIQDPPAIRLLCVEDNPDDFELMALALDRAAPGRRWQLQRVEDAAGMGQALADPPDVVLCDYHLPRFSPREALATLRQAGSTAPLVLVTRAIGEDAAVEMLRAGARDYVTKDRLATLPQVIDRVLAERDQARERERLSAQLETAYRRLQSLSARLVAAQERERDHLSHVLHDELAQTLAGMVIHLHAARASADPAQAQAHTDTAIRMTQGAIEQLKSVSFSLRPAQLDLLGLVPTLETLVDKEAAAAGLEASVRSRGQEPAGLGDKAAVAVRLVQQALHNVTRHAQARRVWVRVRFLPGGRIGLLVADDGESVDHERLRGEPGHGNLFPGLHGLVEMADLAGGQLRVRTCASRGVAVRAML